MLIDMIWAFGRLFLIFFLTLITFILIVVSLRTLGLKQNYTPFAAELRQHPNMTLVDMSPPPGKENELLAPAAPQSTEIYLLKIKFHPEKQWYIDSNSTDLKDKNPIEVLAQYPESFFYLDIYYPRLRELNGFLENLAQLPNAKKLILSSPLMDTLKGVREFSGPWLTGHSTSEVGRMLLFANLYLEPLLEVPGDVYIMRHPNKRLLKELLRRKIFVFIEISSEAEKLSLAAEHPDLLFLVRRPK